MVGIEKIKADLAKLEKQFEAEKQRILDGADVETRTLLGEAVKRVDKLNAFTANGNKYVFRELTVARFEQFELLQASVGFGLDFQGIFDNLKAIYESLNTADFVAASVKLYNTLEGVSTNLAKRENPILQMCALFICREDENVSVYDPLLISEKIEDWKIEGIAMADFFHLAFNLVQGFTASCKADTLNTFYQSLIQK